MSELKKWLIAIVLITLSFVPMHAAFALDKNAIYVFLDGKKMTFKQQPTIVNGRALVPLRDIFEALGAKIEWNEAAKTVTAKKNNTVITYTIGSFTGNRNNEIITIPVPGQLIDGTTMIPLRFVSEALDTTISWDENSRTILISAKIKTTVVVTSILEGNIVEIKGGENSDKLVLLGYDQLEPGKAEEATQWIAQQLTNATIQVELDANQRDVNGYLLAYVYLPDGSMLNAQVLAKGYAKVNMQAPNLRWNEMLSYVQNGAKNVGAGVWAK
jgi:endonuclease YncB( thermonuclease family)